MTDSPRSGLSPGPQPRTAVSGRARKVGAPPTAAGAGRRARAGHGRWPRPVPEQERGGDRARDDELIRVCALVARVACQRMTPRYLKALYDSVEQACCLPAAFDWNRKAVAHAQIVNVLADAA